jgi:micrococcal nuclease
VTIKQRQSTFYFLVLTALIAVVSVLTSQKISTDSLSTVLGSAKVVNTTQLISSPQSTASAKVVRVIDGDTIELENGEKVRYIGVNTPELHHPQKGKECFGQEAYEKNKSLVEGKVVTLQKDVSETDRYGRLLRYVWIDTTLVNESLVLEGYAFSSSYPPDISLQKFLNAAQERARENKVGLWSGCPIEN